MEVQEAQKQLDALEALSSKSLKQVLAEHSVGFEGVVEKEELIRLAWRALTDLIGANAEPESPGSTKTGFGVVVCLSVGSIPPTCHNAVFIGVRSPRT